MKKSELEAVAARIAGCSPKRVFVERDQGVTIVNLPNSQTISAECRAEVKAAVAALLPAGSRVSIV